MEFHIDDSKFFRASTSLLIPIEILDIDRNVSEAGASLVDQKLGLNVVPKTRVSLTVRQVSRYFVQAHLVTY